ncbi:hypothetical protein pb186bvf_011930 [Paramecium bursaria]
MNSYELQGFVIDLSKEIGKGAYASVFPSRKQNEQAFNYCCKIMDLTQISQQENDKIKVEREYQILKVLMEQSIKNTNVVAIYLIERVVIQNETKLVTIMERCDSDFRVILKQGKVNQDQAYSYMKQIINGYKICYDNEIMHRDIKPENILVKNGNLKLADFGEGKILKDLDKSQNNTKRVGTPAYQSPQIFAGNPSAKKQYSAKLDVFSLGVIFYEMLFGSTPFEHSTKGIKEFHEQLKNNSFIDRLRQSGLDQTTQDLFIRMLAYEEDNRFGWKELFSHPKFSIPFAQQISLKQQLKFSQQKLPIQGVGTNQGLPQQNNFIYPAMQSFQGNTTIQPKFPIQNSVQQNSTLQMQEQNSSIKNINAQQIQSVPQQVPQQTQQVQQFAQQTPSYSPQQVSQQFKQNQSQFPQQAPQVPQLQQIQQNQDRLSTIQPNEINGQAQDNRLLTSTGGVSKLLNYYSLESALAFLLFLIQKLKLYQGLIPNLQQSIKSLICTLDYIGYTINQTLKKTPGFDISQFKMIIPNPNNNQKPVAVKFQEHFNFTFQNNQVSVFKLEILQTDLVTQSRNLVDQLKVDPQQQYPLEFILMYNELVKITQNQRDFTSIENSFNQQCPFEILR